MTRHLDGAITVVRAKPDPLDVRSECREAPAIADRDIVSTRSPRLRFQPVGRLATSDRREPAGVPRC
jgi:hypothetical protein